MSSVLVQLQEWYAAQCDGDWEHSYGINIGTLDNPGWSLGIDLKGTDLEEVPYPEFKHNYDHEQDWFICCRVENMWSAHGGPQQLEAMLSVFLQWARANSPA